MLQTPDEVKQVAEHIDRGVHPNRFSMADDERRTYSSLSERDNWKKIAACGQPYYVHIPSGYAIVVGERDKTAIITPNQMKNIPTLLVDYYRLMDEQNTSFGIINVNLFRDLALAPDDTDHGINKEALYDRLNGDDYPTKQEVIKAVNEAFDLE